MDQICINACRAHWHMVHPACNGDQLFQLVRGRIHIPVLGTEAEFRMVE
jgi:hypothetical protein